MLKEAVAAGGADDGAHGFVLGYWDAAEEQRRDRARAEAASAYFELGPQAMRGVQDLRLTDQHDVVGEAAHQVQARGRGAIQDRAQLQAAETMRFVARERVPITRLHAIDADHADAGLDLLGRARDARDQRTEAHRR